jgi:hypothetical protein
MNRLYGIVFQGQGQKPRLLFAYIAQFYITCALHSPFFVPESFTMADKNQLHINPYLSI